MNEILIAFGSEYLALTSEQFETARQRGREIMPTSVMREPLIQEDAILDAEGIEKRTGVPASWWLEQARQGAIPHIRAGKYVRFRLNEALDALASGARPKDKLSFAVPRRAANQ